MVALTDIAHFLPEYPMLLRASKQITHAFNTENEFSLESDPTHDVNHIIRVMLRCLEIAPNGVRLRPLLIAAIFHDCCNYPKDHADRALSSTVSAAQFQCWAIENRDELSMSYATVQDICRIIKAHSFSANIDCDSIEAAVLSDADKLDALGAIGIARCFTYGGMMYRSLYNPITTPADVDLSEDDLEQRDDSTFTLDHFHTKLYKLLDKMRTPGGIHQAQKAIAFMQEFEKTLRCEVSGGVEIQSSLSPWITAPAFGALLGEELKKSEAAGKKTSQLRALEIFGPVIGVTTTLLYLTPDVAVVLSLTDSYSTRCWIAGIANTHIPVDMDAPIALNLQMLILWISMSAYYKTDLDVMAVCYKKTPSAYNEVLRVRYAEMRKRWDTYKLDYDRECENIDFDLEKVFLEHCIPN